MRRGVETAFVQPRYRVRRLCGSVPEYDITHVIRSVRFIPLIFPDMRACKSLLLGYRFYLIPRDRDVAIETSQRREASWPGPSKLAIKVDACHGM